MRIFDNEHQLADALFANGLWIDGGVPGVIGWSEGFERVVEALDRRVNEIAAADNPIERHFPPVLDRNILARTGYLSSFPELCGSVHSFCGDERAHQAFLEGVERGDEWGAHLQQTGVALTPAVCYPLYPTLAESKLEERQVYSLKSFAFRHEPSSNPDRLQSFRMRENVCIGDAQTVLDWRASWLERAQQLLLDLQLPGRIEVASDPFFGRGGKMLRANQKADEGKFELLCPVTSEDAPTAIASFNFHQSKFSTAYDIRWGEDELAQTGCIGFGLERCALALFSNHGIEQTSWPAEVQSALAL